MYDEQVKEFKSKLPEALPRCEVRFWKEDREGSGLLICYEVRCGQSNPPQPGEAEVRYLRSSHDVEVIVRGIVNALPASWRA
jgi:hypothetical protein